jgi:hypothetical protein
LNPIGNGSASLTSITIPNVPVDREIFFCVTGSGDVLGNEPNGFATVTVGPGSSTDFLSAPVTIEYPGQICYAMGNACDASYVPPPLAIGTPALSVWALIGLAGLILLFGAWKLKGIAAAA